MIYISYIKKNKQHKEIHILSIAIKTKIANVRSYIVTARTLCGQFP